MSQGAIRPETSRDREERRMLEEELATSPVRASRSGSGCATSGPTPTSAIRALGGPTVWMRRLRAIEDEVERHERQLGESWRALAEEVEDPAEFARRGTRPRATGASRR